MLCITWVKVVENSFIWGKRLIESMGNIAEKTTSEP